MASWRVQESPKRVRPAPTREQVSEPTPRGGVGGGEIPPQGLGIGIWMAGSTRPEAKGLGGFCPLGSRS